MFTVIVSFITSFGLFGLANFSSAQYNEKHLVQSFFTRLYSAPKISEDRELFSCNWSLSLYPLETSENLWLSEIFGIYRKRSLVWNGLKGIGKIFRDCKVRWKIYRHSFYSCGNFLWELGEISTDIYSMSPVSKYDAIWEIPNQVKQAI